MIIPRFLARQLARPSGRFGRWIMGPLLNRANASHNRLVVRSLRPSPADRVLEIGFGGGFGLEALLAATPRGWVAGIERSGAMLDAARARHRDAVRGGRLALSAGSVEALPFRDGSFDGACSVNTIYFWRSLEAGLRELRRVLRPGGRLVLGYGSREAMARLGLGDRGFALYSPDDLERALRATGFAPDDLSSFSVGRNTAYATRAVRAT